MKSFLFAVIAALLACSAMGFSNSAFAGKSLAGPKSTSQLNMFFGPKDDGSPGDYICLDCGYVFTKGPKAWADLPNDWSCPPCGSVKRRFKKVPKGEGQKTQDKKKKGGFFG
mmetsp:Transcript_14835/g.20947  ORF Transcript_14835/g.20947 Transcript_14835/m.20947 type:complete len:112 (-) Transcript_14835:173-508(-)